MFSKTEKTIRIKNIPANTTKDEVEKFAEELCGSTRSHGKAIQIFNLGRRSVTSSPLLVSLTPQTGTQTATITLPSKADKNKAVQVKEPREHWVVDDNFNSLTVFHQEEKRLVDICVVHGLEGNAFGTWAWDGTTLTDWKPYLRKVANLMGLRGDDFEKMLGAFNNMSKVSKRDFAQLPYQVPFECLHETNKTELGPLHRKVIVSADTAGLNGVSARPMLDVNHRDICKFPNKTHPGYAQIAECLKRIMDRIDTTSSAPTASQPANTASETRQGIRSGVGKGGSISGNKAGGLEVSGGSGTGASMSFEDYRKLSGTDFVIGGGEGLDARIT